jgi:hypothetical protein
MSGIFTQGMTAAAQATQVLELVVASRGTERNNMIDMSNRQGDTLATTLTTSLVTVPDDLTNALPNFFRWALSHNETP